MPHGHCCLFRSAFAYHRLAGRPPTTPCSVADPSPNCKPQARPLRTGLKYPKSRTSPIFVTTPLTRPTDGGIISRVYREMRMLRRCETESLSRAPTAHAAAPQAALGPALQGMPKRPNRMQEALRARRYSRRMEQTCCRCGFPQENRWRNAKTAEQGPHHVDESLVQKAVREAVTRAGLTKRAT